MNAILVSTVSILAIAGSAWAMGRLLKVRLCPVCLGVGGTWLWMVVARFAGAATDSTMLAVLLGGSVAGTAHLLERHLPQGRSTLVWKVLFIPIGFVGAYGVATSDWILFAGSMAVATILAAVFFRPASTARAETPGVADLERRLKDCC